MIHKNSAKYAEWKALYENALQSDDDLSRQWSFIGIDTNITKKDSQFVNKSDTIRLNAKGVYILTRQSTKEHFNPYQYYVEYFTNTLPYQDFICKALNVPTYDDFMNDNKVVSKPYKAVVKKEYEVKKSTTKELSKIKSFEVKKLGYFDGNIDYYLHKKANIEKYVLQENNIFQLKSAAKTYENGYVSKLESSLLFGVQLENSTCFKVIDKVNKKVNWFPNLDFAKENGLLPKDYSYSLGIDTLTSKQNYAYLVGGEMDFSAAKTYGFGNVFTLGSENASINPYVINKLVEKGIKVVYVLYDNDFAGVENSLKLHNKVIDGITFKRLELPKLPIQSFKLIENVNSKYNGLYKHVLGNHFEKTDLPKNAIIDKPIDNDICDYLTKYGFDADFQDLLNVENYTEPTPPTPPKIYKKKDLISYDYEVSVKRYLSDKDGTNNILLKDKTILNAIETKKCVLIDSKPNTGKTTVSVGLAEHLAKNKNKKTIVVEFYNAIAEQQAGAKSEGELEKLLFISKTFEENYELLKKSIEKENILKLGKEQLNGANSDIENLLLSNIDSELLKELSTNCISYVNANNLKRTCQIYELLGIDVQLVIDEAHELSNSTTYRIEVINEVIEVMQKYNSVLLSGTPLKFYFETYNIKINSIEKKPFPRPKIFVGSGIKTIQKTIDLITENKDRNTLLLCNNTTTNRKIKDRLLNFDIDSNFFASSELNELEEEEFKKFKKTHTFHFNKSVVLGTKAITTGTNIESEKPALLIYLYEQNGFDIIEYDQFRHRLRNYESLNVEIVIIVKELNEKEKYYDFDFKKQIKFAKMDCDYFNSKLELANPYEKSKMKLDCTKVVSFNELEQKFEVNYLAIQKMYSEHLIDNSSVLFENPINVETLESVEVDKDTITIDALVTDQNKTIESNTCKLVLNDYENLCKSVYKDTQDKILQSDCFKECVNVDLKDDENDIKLSSSELKSSELILKRIIYLKPYIGLNELKTLLIVEDATFNYKFLDSQKYAILKHTIKYDYCIKNFENLECRTELELNFERIIKLESILSEPTHAKEILKKINKYVRKSKQVTSPQLEFLLERFFDITEQKENRKTLLTGILKTQNCTVFNQFFNEYLNEKK